MFGKNSKQSKSAKNAKNQKSNVEAAEEKGCSTRSTKNCSR